MRSRLVVAVLCAAGLMSAPAIVSAQALETPERSPSALAPDLAVDAPPGFSDSVVGRVDLPTGLAWTPDGRMLVIGKAGRLLVVEEGSPNDVVLNMTARVCSEKELGLVGIAVDPKFQTNKYVYLYYTHRRGGTCGVNGGPVPQNRVGRFVLRADNTVDPASETVIVDHITVPREHHIAGDLEFGEDGYLYISVGDGVCALTGDGQCGPLNNNSQVQRIPHGKILRVGRNGVPVPTNPYANVVGARRCTDPRGIPAGTGPCKEIFASGFRNPFRMARRPGTNAFFVNDVGLNTWEEVNRLVAGKNYGWNVREGHCVRDSATNCGPTSFQNPIFDYRHGDNCRSITGGAFVPDGLWPGFDDAYLFADYACGRVWRLDQGSGGAYQRSPFMTGLAGPVQLRFGPYGDTQALYYVGLGTSTIHRVTTTNANTAPVADFDYRPDGQELSFDGAGSSDADSGDEVVSWQWDFGDGATTTTNVPDVTHTYTGTAPQQVTLTVEDNHGLASAPVTKTVNPGEHPPAVTITGPSPTARFSVDQAVTLAATASDPEDGTLPGTSIDWTVLRRHANHTHPFLDDVTGASTRIIYPDPEDLAAAADSSLIAYATATDSRGLKTTVTQVLLPDRAELRFATLPAGGRVVVEGTSRQTPASVISWAGHRVPVRVPDQRIDGVLYTFKSWSDGGARAHDIVTPKVRTGYVARLVRP